MRAVVARSMIINNSNNKRCGGGRIRTRKKIIIKNLKNKKRLVCVIVIEAVMDGRLGRYRVRKAPPGTIWATA